MKKTPIDQIQILFQQLTGSALDAAITGNGYLLKRPDNSTKEDYVINALPLSGDQFQIGGSNVNIYVPDVTVRIEGKATNMPNTARLLALANMAITVLTERYLPSYGFSLASMNGPIEESDIKQHYINLRIDFQFFPDS